LNLTETPIAEEKGEDLKKEVLILLDGSAVLKSFNGEEVSSDDISDAKNEKAERIKAAEEARKAAEEEAAAAKKEAEDAAAAAKAAEEDA
jgi:hypothetical protein